MTPEPSPAFYFPIENDCYEVKPGLVSVSKDHGNGQQDHHIFQFDNTFPRYRHNKLQGREEKLSKYFCTNKFTVKQQSIISQFIIKKLCLESPEYFSHEKMKNEFVLNCKLSNEIIVYNAQAEELSDKTSQYESLFDALAMQVQEDIAVIKLESSGNSKIDNRVTALHLFAPNHWAASDKIGQNFISVHQTVAGMEQIVKNQNTILSAMIHKGPYVRFAWGLSTDDRLNHHPIAPDQQSQQLWQGREFVAGKSSLFLRVERQTINGFTAINSALFTIRSYFYAIENLSTAHKITIVKALQSITPDQLIYKGLLHDREPILQYLSALI